MIQISRPTCKYTRPKTVSRILTCSVPTRKSPPSRSTALRVESGETALGDKQQNLPSKERVGRRRTPSRRISNLRTPGSNSTLPVRSLHDGHTTHTVGPRRRRHLDVSIQALAEMKTAILIFRVRDRVQI